jgi:hypothetical protein
LPRSARLAELWLKNPCCLVRHAAPYAFKGVRAQGSSCQRIG